MIKKQAAEGAKTLSEILKEARKKYGEGTLAFADDFESLNLEVIPTNCYSLDDVFGVGGLPRGRIIEIFGQPSGGKTAMCLYLIAQAQKEGKTAAFIDAEYSYSSDYAQKLGVDTKELVYMRPETGEDVFDVVEDLVKSGEVAIIIVDSTAALIPASEAEGEISDSTIALQARLLGKGLRRMIPFVSKTNTTVIFISQTRDRIGGYGPTKESTGGNALKFFASVRLEVNKLKGIESDGALIGNRLKIKAVKNKVAPPFREAEIELYFERGIDQILDLIDYAERYEIIEKAGHTYSFEGEKIGVGKENACKEVSENQDLQKKIRTKVEAFRSKKDPSENKGESKEGKRSRATDQDQKREDAS